MSLLGNGMKCIIEIKLESDGSIDFQNEEIKKLLPFTNEEILSIKNGKSIIRDYDFGSKNLNMMFGSSY